MNRFKIILSILLLVIIQKTHGQKVLTEGTIQYKVTVSGISDPQTQVMMQNMVMNIYIKNEKLITEMDMGIIKTKTIMESPNKYVTLMDLMGQKIKYTSDKKQFEDKKLKDEKYDVIVTDETKIIAGYNCKKAIIKTKDGKSFFAYYTNEISKEDKTNFLSPYGKIDGLLMEYSMEQKGNTMTMLCTSIEFNPISDGFFIIPESGYTEMSADQIKKMGGL